MVGAFIWFPKMSMKLKLTVTKRPFAVQTQLNVSSKINYSFRTLIRSSPKYVSKENINRRRISDNRHISTLSFIEIVLCYVIHCYLYSNPIRRSIQRVKCVSK